MEIKSKLAESLADLMGRVFCFAEAEQGIERLFRDDRALDRALNFTGSFVTLGNVLGPTPRFDIAMWVGSDARIYPVCRSVRWDSDGTVGMANGRLSDSKSDGDAVERDLAEDLITGRVKHSEIRTVSLIREPLWDEAKWRGVAYAWDEDGKGCPVLALCFEDAKASEKIFALWRKEIGEVDAGEMLRVVLVRGICRENVHAYRVIVGINPGAACRESEARFAIIVSRLQTMQATTSRNVDAFLANYRSVGTYLLSRGVGGPGGGGVRILRENSLLKRELVVRDAWAIGKGDIDSAGVLASDNPLIPNDRLETPVQGLLRWKRGQR
jgi:hypothetical protein